MTFRSFSDSEIDRDNAEINMIPLIDIMLVLLVIFIVTAPLMTHAVKVDLPKASSLPNDVLPRTINLSIKSDGTIYWDGERVDDSALQPKMADAAMQANQPEVHVRADGELAYRNVARVMSDAARAGLTRLGFVTTPETLP